MAVTPDLVRANPYHDEQGRFASGPGEGVKDPYPERNELSAARVSLIRDDPAVRASHDWQSTKPWLLSAADIAAGKAPGISARDLGRGTGNDTLGTVFGIGKGIIINSTTWDNAPVSTRADVLYHELGHLATGAVLADEERTKDILSAAGRTPMDASSWGRLGSSIDPGGEALAYLYGELVTTEPRFEQVPDYNEETHTGFMRSEPVESDRAARDAIFGEAAYVGAPAGTQLVLFGPNKADPTGKFVRAYNVLPTSLLLAVRTKVVSGDLLGARALLGKYSDDQPRVPAGEPGGGEFGQGGGAIPPKLTGALGKAADYWIEGSVDVRHALAAGHVIAGESPKSIGAGRALAAAVVETGGPAPELYRGICRSGDDPHELDSLTNLKPGATFNGNLASWSSDQNIAKDFGGLFGDPRFLLKLEGGAQGLDLGDHSVMSQKEWITDGRFEVVSVDRNVKGGVQSRWGDTRTPLRATVITLRQAAVFDVPAQFVGSKVAKAKRLPWPDEFNPALEVAFDQRMASPDAQAAVLHEQRGSTTKAAATRRLVSGGARRDASLDPIVARVRQQLIDLIQSAHPELKAAPKPGLHLNDQLRATLKQGYKDAWSAGWQDSGVGEDPPDDGGDDESEAMLDGQSSFLTGLVGALLLGGLTAAMVGSRMGSYASTVNPLYERGFGEGVAGQGQITSATWQSEGDADTCDLCLNRDGQVWYGDDPHPYPGDGGFGGDTCLGGTRCRCSLLYDIVPTAAAEPADQPDDVTTMARPGIVKDRRDVVRAYKLSGLDTIALLVARRELLSGHLLTAQRLLGKYSEDQPRDADGRFGEGSGETGGVPQEPESPIKGPRTGHRIDPVPVGLNLGGTWTNQYFCEHCNRDLEITPTGYRHDTSEGTDSHRVYDRFMRQTAQKLLLGKYSEDQPRVPAGQPGGGEFGSGEGGEAGNPHAYTAFERDIAAKAPKTEYAQVYAKDGTPITPVIEGESHRVLLQSETEDWRGATLTHYHPDETGDTLMLSAADVGAALEKQLGSVRAFSADGYFMEMTNAGGMAYSGEAFERHFQSVWSGMLEGFRARAATMDLTSESFGSLSEEFRTAYRQTLLDAIGQHYGLSVGTGKI